MNIKISEKELLEVLLSYTPKVLSNTKAYEICNNIKSYGEKIKEKYYIDDIELENILYKYYPRVSHKNAGRIIRDIKRKSEVIE
ncbi:hypothetical protein ABGF48_01365 [Helcococcus bovis]|uniref:hypothetical protein n=1 Tax=Helcococcus bovis TaxID=3153252 RepID=UPI0038BC3DB9